MNERELLYKVLFEMKRDMNEMRRQLNGLLTASAAPQHSPAEVVVQQHGGYEQVVDIQDDSAVEVVEAPQSIEAVVEESPIKETPITTMEDMEREGIRRALERHKGCRKAAAAELHISERTLYRKIKEFGL
jgi:transcriptional regulator with PAS, ATPase and Fis domain